MAWPSDYLLGDPAEAGRTAPEGPPSASASIPGLEARHTWFQTNSGFMDTTPRAALNYRWKATGERRAALPTGLSARAGQVAVGAVSFLDRIGGLHARADFEDNRGNNNTRMGEYLLPSPARGRTITYEGRIQGGSLQALREATALMRGAYSTSEGIMLVEYHPTYSPVTEVVWMYFGRVTQFDVTDEQLAGPGAIHPYERGFTVAIRQHDPRYYRWNPSDGAGFVGTGSFAVDGAGHALVNEGNAPADPVYTLAAPGTNVTIYNATLDATLSLLGLPDLTGTTLTVDFGLRLAYKGFFEGDLTGHVNLSASNAWDSGKDGLAPGTNVVGIASSAGTWSAKWRGAFW